MPSIGRTIAITAGAGVAAVAANSYIGVPTFASAAGVTAAAAIGGGLITNYLIRGPYNYRSRGILRRTLLLGTILGVGGLGGLLIAYRLGVTHFNFNDITQNTRKMWVDAALAVTAGTLLLNSFVKKGGPVKALAGVAVAGGLLYLGANIWDGGKSDTTQRIIDTTKWAANGTIDGATGLYKAATGEDKLPACTQLENARNCTVTAQAGAQIYLPSGKYHTLDHAMQVVVEKLDRQNSAFVDVRFSQDVKNQDGTIAVPRGDLIAVKRQGLTTRSPN
jgi:hypothetical protein